MGKHTKIRAKRPKLAKKVYDNCRSFQYKAEVSQQTRQNLIRTLISCQRLYNDCLNQKKQAWSRSRTNINYNDQQNELPDFKLEFPEHKDINAFILQDVLRRLHKAFANFFRRCKEGAEDPGYPRYKSRSRYKSITLGNQSGWTLTGNILEVKNLGRFKLFLSRPILGEIQTINIKLDSCRDIFVTFICNHVPKKIYPEIKSNSDYEDDSVGLDMGLIYFLADSDNQTIKAPKFFRKAEKNIVKKQRSLSRKKKGSKNRDQSRIQVAKAHRKVSRQRRDFLHKVSYKYIKNYQTVYIENLTIKKMVLNHLFSKSIHDASWYLFFTFLIYKAEEAGRLVVEVDPYQTSQRCSRCHKLVPKTLSNRIHKCPYCGLVLDRDTNSAKDIKWVGTSLRSKITGFQTIVGPRNSLTDVTGESESPDFRRE